LQSEGRLEAHWQLRVAATGLRKEIGDKAVFY